MLQKGAQFPNVPPRFLTIIILPYGYRKAFEVLQSRPTFITCEVCGSWEVKSKGTQNRNLNNGEEILDILLMEPTNKEILQPRERACIQRVTPATIQSINVGNLESD